MKKKRFADRLAEDKLLASLSLFRYQDEVKESVERILDGFFSYPENHPLLVIDVSLIRALRFDLGIWDEEEEEDEFI